MTFDDDLFDKRATDNQVNELFYRKAYIEGHVADDIFDACFRVTLGIPE